MNHKRVLWPVFALLLSLAAAAGLSGSPALSLGWYGGGACDDAEAQNPGDPNGCRYEAQERNCSDYIDNDSDERADCADPDCAGAGLCGACVPSGAEDCSLEGDEDCDGAADAADSECAGLCTTSWWAFWMPRCVEVCGNGIDDDGDSLTDCADREDCSGQPSCQTDCSGSNFCNPLCPEYAGHCECNPSDPACGKVAVCTPESVCMQDCPAYDACACDPTGPTCDGCDGTMTCNPNCPEYNSLDTGCCDGGQVCNTICPEYDPCECTPGDPSCEEACGNGKDDDGDGLIDESKTADPASPECPYEFETNCFDGMDNDSDGATDCADIADCSGKGRFEEAYSEVKELYVFCQNGGVEDHIQTSMSLCVDGVDNDRNSYVDCQDSACHGNGSPCLGEGGFPSGCSNHIDDDGDGPVDCDDTDCQNSLEDLCAGAESETGCFDGIDNEGDGKTDCADDECFGVMDYDTAKFVNEWTASSCGCGPNGGQICDLSQEPSRCFDSSDNDKDGKIDRQDGDCAQFLDEEPEQCQNGIDDDKDGTVDCLDSSCYFDPSCVETNCANGVDDDRDGVADCGDFDCQGSPDCN